MDPRGLDHPGMGPYAIGATVYYYAGATGHVGIGVNGSSSFGYYPTAPSKTDYELVLPGVPGRVELDKLLQSQPDGAIWLEGSINSTERLKGYIRNATLNPGTYTLPFNNCTTFAASALRDSGFQNIPFSLIPLSYINSLERIHGKKTKLLQYFLWYSFWSSFLGQG